MENNTRTRKHKREEKKKKIYFWESKRFLFYFCFCFVWICLVFSQLFFFIQTYFRSIFNFILLISYLENLKKNCFFLFLFCTIFLFFISFGFHSFINFYIIWCERSSVKKYLCPLNGWYSSFSIGISLKLGIRVEIKLNQLKVLCVSNHYSSVFVNLLTFVGMMSELVVYPCNLDGIVSSKIELLTVSQQSQFSYWENQF